MAYVLTALIAPSPVAHDAAQRIGAAVVDLDQSLTLVPLVPDAGATVALFGDDLDPVSEVVIEAATAASDAGPIALVAAELFGAAGPQGSIVWHLGTVADGPTFTDLVPPAFPPRDEWPINRALRLLGVSRGDAVDEFAAVGLGRHRRTEEWLAAHE